MRQVGTRTVNRTAAMKRAHLMREIVETALFVVIVFVIVNFAIRPYRVTDVNMQPQLAPDELVVVNKAAYLLGAPGHGDVVVYYDPTNLNQQLIGRVIAGPGDTIRISPVSVAVNGVTLNETYANIPEGVAPNSNPLTLKLRANEFFIMNDARLSASDSRTFGPVSRGNIVGKAELVFWPVKSLHGVSTFPGVFTGVK